MVALILSAQDHERISAAVGQAELLSDGEIVTMVSRRSDEYADWALMLSVLAAFGALVAIVFFHAEFVAALSWMSGDWHADYTPQEQLGAALAVSVIAFAAVRLALTWDWLLLALTPGILKGLRVRARAIRAFKIGISSRTRAATGVLIYLSIAEHRAEILGDEAINARITADDWAEAMQALVSQVRAGRPADGIIAAVELCGTLLAKHFPRQTGDQNELPDRLIEL